MNRSVNKDETPEPVAEEPVQAVAEEAVVVDAPAPKRKPRKRKKVPGSKRVLAPEPEPEEVQPEIAMSINDVRDRFTGIVNNARSAGLASVTSRGFAALEGFFGALAGDKEKRPPPKG
jgi:hypothetical protein